MTKKVKTIELFDLKSELIKDIFESFIYPWEILTHIGLIFNKGEQLTRFDEIQKGVFVGKNVKIDKSAVIIPPVIVDDGCEIRTGAFIRGNVICGKNCVIGNSTELKNCILLEGVQVPHYNYVGDSILGNFVHLGAGVICSNLKSDGKNVVIKGEKMYDTGMRKLGAILGDGADIGCGCVLNPGTVIGKKTSVYPLNSLRGVYSDNLIIKSNADLVKRI